MSNIAPYPHVEIDVEDSSIYIPIKEDSLPLHRPIYFMRTERGPIGIPIWRDTQTEANATFGSETFNQRSKYFSPSAYFLKKTFQNNGAFIVRVADTDAKNARIVIELAVTEKAIQQYKRDENGKFMLDSKDQKIPINKDGETISELQAIYDAETKKIEDGEMTDEDRTVQLEQLQPKTMDGYELKWLGRAMPQGATDDEDIDFSMLTPTKVVNDDSTTTTFYPMFTFVASSGGEWGNSMGFKLYYDPKNNRNDTITRNGACYYTLAPIELPAGSTSASAIRNKYSNTEVSFVVKPNATDSITGVDISAEPVLEAAYSDGYELPVKIQIFPENFNAVGNLILQSDPEARERLYIDYNDDDVNDWAESEQGYMVNLFSNVDIDGVPFKTIDLVEPDGIETGVIAMSSSAIHYMVSGSDGDISDAATEEYMRLLLADTTNEYLIDKPRFPFNCLFDTGFSMDTKRAMIAFLDVREDVKVVLGSQISWKTKQGTIPDVNNKYTDESVGMALREECLSMRESIAKGTGCCRAIVFTQAGKTADWDRWLPTTLWLAIKKSEYLNRDFMNQEPKELPNSDVDIWKEISWTATSEDTKNRVWNYGLNYMQYYNRTSVHYASLRSVYKYDTSVLVDDSFVDAVIFVKQLTYTAWARFAGSTDKTASLQQRIYDHLMEIYQYMLHGKFGVDVEVYQTDEDVKLGFVQHIDIHLSSPGQNRVWRVNIICERDGYSSESEE